MSEGNRVPIFTDMERGKKGGRGVGGQEEERGRDGERGKCQVQRL